MTHRFRVFFYVDVDMHESDIKQIIKELENSTTFDVNKELGVDVKYVEEVR